MYVLFTTVGDFVNKLASGEAARHYRNKVHRLADAFQRGEADVVHRDEMVQAAVVHLRWWGGQLDAAEDVRRRLIMEGGNSLELLKGL